MYKLINYTFLILSTLCAYSQGSLKEVDSISYRLYEEKQWERLVQYDKEIIDNKFDYYYYNIRIGIANFQIKNYDESISFFEKALRNNDKSMLAKEYLFWSYFYLKKRKKARKYYNMLDAKTKKSMAYQPRKLLDYIYMEGGNTFQKNNNKNQGDIQYFNVGLHHKISSQFNIYHAYYFNKQPLEYSSYRQQRYFLKPSIWLKNNYKMSLGISQVRLKSTIDYESTGAYNHANDTVIDNIPYQQLVSGIYTEKNTGTYKEQKFYVEVSIAKFFETLKIATSIGLSHETNKTNTKLTTNGVENVIYNFEGIEVFNQDFPFNNDSSNDSDSSYTNYHLGLGMGYDFTNKLSASVDVIGVLSPRKVDYNYFTSLIYKLNKKIKFTGQFIYKGTQDMYFLGGSQLINSRQKQKRFDLISDVLILKKMNLYLVYQHNNFSETMNNSKALIFGLKYSL